MKTDYVLIGERIKFWRQQRNLTQEELAEMVALTPGFISLIETGKKKPSLETLLFICKELKITLNDLLVENRMSQATDYNTKFAELIFNLNDSERKLMFETIRSMIDVLKTKKD